MRAGIGQRVELAVLAAGDDDRLAADEDGQVVVDIGDLALVREVDPVALEDVLHLELEQLLVGESRAIQLIDVLDGIFVQHRVELGELAPLPW